MSSLAGSFLVARPVLREATFRESVVLLLQHGDEGAFGLVVNRPAAAKGLPFRVFRGGPCSSDGLFMLHGHSQWLESAEERSEREIVPGLYLGDASCLSRVSQPKPGKRLRYRMFSGYSGWGPDQLESELAEGVWAVVQATPKLLFETPVRDLWCSLLPPMIPQPSLN